ncbi:sensor histidine kinase [Marinobacter halodurans]|uniref:sensor histidine kinase n=1 Tax=Marinobacter halodurans TaxID=2528979 RepID=UPI0013F1639B|nr:histidine kinase [Marinobacter halodurans]
MELEIYFSNPQEWHRIMFVPEKNEQGDLTSVLSLGQDITRQKQIDHELRESRSLLRELGARREAELEAERKHIAHEIHEELGQLLTTLRLNLSLTCSQLPGEDSPLREKLNDMTRLVDRTIQTVRNIATSLRPAVLNAGIASALEWLTQEFTRHSGIRCKLTLQEGIQLDEERATVVFRLVQESLSNVGRHSGADQVWIRLCHHVTGYYHLTIRDNGSGFDPEAINNHQSFGLIGMQ